ncbi:MAG: aminopeptidase P family protein [Anaerolineae bacterium]|nr:aminopeptidase P family protein [Anaerolineae bacterium]
MTTPPFGRHRTKISPLQTPSEETIAYAKSLDGQVLGPGELAYSEWAALGLELPDLPTMRHYRLERVRKQLRRLDYGGILLYDPLNIRYATDSSNMQIWTMHNAVRYCYIATDGPIVLFDFHNCEHLSVHLELIDEIRPAVAWYYFGAGDRVVEIAERWAAELADLVRAYGGGNTRLAIDHCNEEGIAALHRQGVQTFNGEEVMELARVIKCQDEIKAMRCAIATCERSMEIMQAKMEPGVTEQRLWSYLHAENIARGGEWIETRLLASGPRTNPWFHECSSRVIEAGDIVAFDTDLIGPYGMCADISRTWLCGDQPPTAEQRGLYRMAYEQIQTNQAMLKPGISFRELTEQAQSLPSDYLPNHYSVLYHGVGLCDEYPSIYYPDAWADYGYDGILEENMVLCVESYVGRVGGHEGVKLEEQVLITADGPVLLSAYPFEADFLR